MTNIALNLGKNNGKLPVRTFNGGFLRNLVIHYSRILTGVELIFQILPVIPANREEYSRRYKVLNITE